MYKNGKGINIDKVSELHDNTFKNGLEVSVVVKATGRELEKAIEKLIYFEKLHIEYIKKDPQTSWDELSYDTVRLFNERKIVHFKTFSACNFRSNLSDKYLKVGNVLYKNKDWNDLYTSSISVNIPVGEVDITPNREELQFTDKTKEVINKYIRKVKTELQELANEVQNKDLTLKAFFDCVTSHVIHYNKDDITLNIDKKDVSIDTSKITIKSKHIPANFDNFLAYLRYKSVDKGSIYKVINCDKYYNYRKLNKANIGLSSILAEFVYIADKKDNVTKAITIKWFTESVAKDNTIAILYSIDSFKETIKSYAYQSNSLWNVDKCTEFLFEILETYKVSNDDVPESYKKTYRESNKKKKTKINDTAVSVRWYTPSGYGTHYLKFLPKHKLYVYCQNVKDGTKLIDLANLLTWLDDVEVITLKKEDFPCLENNRRFVLLDDFLDIPNNVLKKITTVSIILKHFDSVSKECDISLYDLPIVKEFNKKYKKYVSACRSCYNNLYETIVKKYENNGWYNKVDVNYFKINEFDVTALKTIQNMLLHKNEIVKCMAFFMFGKKDKIGLNCPKINICKYIKQFKHECI